MWAPCRQLPFAVVTSMPPPLYFEIHLRPTEDESSLENVLLE